MSEAIAIIQDAEKAVVALHPLRIAILENLDHPMSSSSLSPKLGVPRQHVNYHMRELEAAGFVRMVEERKKGNVTERLYESTAKYFLIGTQALGAIRAEPSLVPDHESSDYLAAMGGRLVDDVSALRSTKADVTGLALEGEISFASEAERAEFGWDLARILTQLVSKYDKPGGTHYRVAFFSHPTLSKD